MFFLKPIVISEKSELSTPERWHVSQTDPVLKKVCALHIPLLNFWNPISNYRIFWNSAMVSYGMGLEQVILFTSRSTKFYIYCVIRSSEIKAQQISRIRNVPKWKVLFFQDKSLTTLNFKVCSENWVAIPLDPKASLFMNIELISIWTCSLKVPSSFNNLPLGERKVPRWKLLDAIKIRRILVV